MALTPKGIYFPEGTARADFVETFNNIAQSVDDALGDFTYDSGWIEVPNSQMTGGWSSYSTTRQNLFEYRRVGKLVACKGRLSGGTPGSIFYQLPLGFRPPGTMYFAAERNTSITGIVNIIVASNGRMYTRDSGGDSVSWVPLTAIHYFTDNNT